MFRRAKAWPPRNEPFPAMTASSEQGPHRPDGHGVRRVREYGQVQAEGPVVDVEQVQPPVRAERRVVPGFGLPQAGYPWSHDGPPLQLLVELGGFLGHGESRSYQAHPAGQDIPELRELVDARRPQDAADPGHPRVVGRLEEGTALPLVHRREVVGHLGGVRHHRAELEHVGLNPVPADHGMPVEDRATVFQADADRGRQQHRRGQRKQDGGGHDVDGSLRRMVPGRRPVRLDVEHRQTGHRSGADPAAEHSGQPGPELDMQPAGQAIPYRGGALGRGHCAADEDHAFGADLLGELRKVGQRRPARNALPGCHVGFLAHDASDPVTELRLVGEHLPHGPGVLVGTYEHYGLQELPVRALVLQPPPDSANAARSSMRRRLPLPLLRVRRVPPRQSRRASRQPPTRTRLRPLPRLSGRPGGRTQSTPRTGTGRPFESPRASKRQPLATRLPTGPGAADSGRASEAPRPARLRRDHRRRAAAGGIVRIESSGHREPDSGRRWSVPRAG